MLGRIPSAAVALATAAVAVLVVVSRGTTPPPASAATALYASAAALARSGPSLELGPHSYLYERSVGWSRFLNPGGHALLHELSETWTARDGAGHGRDVILSPAVARRLPFRVSLSKNLRLRASAHPFMLAYPVALSYAQLQRLPISPKRLAVVVGHLADRAARAMGQRSSRQGHSVLVLYILHSIANSPAPTAVRAAVYEVMASTRGVRLVGHRRDALGRKGDMFAATWGPVRTEMIINPATGRLLQFTRILLRPSRLMPGWVPGVINRDTYVELAVAGSASKRPH